MHAHGVDVLDGADRDHLAFGVAHDLELELFPAEHAFLDEHFCNRRCRKTARHDGAQLFDVVYQAAARAAHGVGGAQHARVAELVGDFDGFFDRVRDLALGHLDAELGHGLLEDVAVLAAFDGVDRRADNLDAVLVEHTCRRKRAREVETRLPAQVGQQRVGAFLLDDFGEPLDVERLDVDRVCGFGVGHDGRRIAVHEHYLVTEAAQRLARLRSRIVEFACLADDDGARTDDEYFLDIVAFGHECAPFLGRPEISYIAL